MIAADPDAIVLSPGPCTPNEAGICLDLIEKAAPTIPMFGVCLGHQAIGQAFGGEVVRAPVPVHGKLSEVTHQGEGVFRGINGPFQATRYHSLVVDRATMPDELAVTAETDDRLVMGARAQDAAGARRAVPSRKHRVRARPSHPEEFPRPRRGVERQRPAAGAGARRRTEGSHGRLQGAHRPRSRPARR